MSTLPSNSNPVRGTEMPSPSNRSFQGSQDSSQFASHGNSISFEKQRKSAVPIFLARPHSFVPIDKFESLERSNAALNKLPERSDQVALSAFLTADQCHFLGITLGIFSCRDLVSFDRFVVAKALKKWSDEGYSKSRFEASPARPATPTMNKKNDAAMRSLSGSRDFSDTNINRNTKNISQSGLGRANWEGHNTLDKDAPQCRDTAYVNLPLSQNEKINHDRPCDVKGAGRPLKCCEAQVFSWLLAMERTRAKRALPPLTIFRRSKSKSDRHVSSDHSKDWQGLAVPVTKSLLQGRKMRQAEKPLPPPLNSPSSESAIDSFWFSQQKGSEKILDFTKVLLSEVLSEDDCSFLASRWIFTSYQLLFMVESESRKEYLAQSCVEWSERDVAEVIEYSGEVESADQSDIIDPPLQLNSAPLPQKEMIRKGLPMVENARALCLVAAMAQISHWVDQIRERARELPEASNGHSTHQQPILTLFRNEDALFLNPSSKAIPPLPLDGSISVLFPEWFLAFMRENNVSTVQQFLENCTQVKEMMSFRASMNLTRLNEGVCSRYLRAMASRALFALALDVPINSELQDWAISPMVALNETARLFLTSKRLLTAENFLRERTIDLATCLMQWRSKNGLPTLKGKGANATVSAWKAACKEVTAIDGDVDIQSHHLEEDFDAAANRHKGQYRERFKVAFLEGESGSDDAVAHSNLGDVSVASSVSVVDGDDDTISEGFDVEIADVLKGPPAKFLKKLGITVASELIRIDKSEDSDLVIAMIEWRKVQGYPEIQASSCVRSIYDWLKRIKERKVMRCQAMPSRRRRRNMINIMDPIDVVSQTTKRFLDKLGIKTAQQLLSTKTMEIADAFAKWRANEGMAELKGTGAIASVSGWKGCVRAAGGHKVLLKDDDALRTDFQDEVTPQRYDIDHGGVPENVLEKRSVVRETKPCAMIIKHDLIPGSCDEEIRGVPDLCAMEVIREREARPAKVGEFSSWLLSVRNARDGTLYDFLIDVRESRSSSFRIGLFLTFLGAKCKDVDMTMGKVDFSDSESSSLRAPQSTSENPSRLVELDHENLVELRRDLATNFQNADYKRFDSFMDGCGVLCLKACDSYCRRDHDADQFSWMKKFINGQAINTNCKFPPLVQQDSDCICQFLSVSGPDDSGKAISVDLDSNNRCYRIRVNYPMEKGQVVELPAQDDCGDCDHSFGRNLRREFRSRLRVRKRLQCSLNKLSLKEVDVFLSFAEDSIRRIAMDTNAILEHGKKVSHSEAACVNGSTGLNRLVVARRRVHWLLRSLASAIDNGSDENSTSLTVSSIESPRVVTRARLKKNLDDWKRFAKMLTASMEKDVKEEIKDEIMFLACVKGYIRGPINQAEYCQLGERHLNEQLNLIAEFVFSEEAGLYQDNSTRLEVQKSLFKQISRNARAAGERLTEICERLLKGADNSAELRFYGETGQDVSAYIHLARLRSGFSKMGTKWNFLSLHPSRLTHQVVGQLADAYMLQDFEELFDERLPCNVRASQKEKSSTTCYMTSDLNWKEGQTAFSASVNLHGLPRDLGAFQRGVAKINMIWYLIYQVLAISHAVASVGVRWMYIKRNGVDGPIYSLYELLRAMRVETSCVEVLMPDGSNAAMDFQDFVELGHVTTDKADKSEIVPETKEIFRTLVWPVLQSSGWKDYSETKRCDGPFGATRTVEGKLCKPLLAGDRVPSRLEMNTAGLPLTLKSAFVRDWESALRQGGHQTSLDASLPASVTVKHVLDSYLEHLCQDSDDDVVNFPRHAAFVKGVETLFGSVFLSVLLYRNEIGEFRQSQRDPAVSIVNPCEVFGCQYLLRLFVLLPTLLHDAGFGDSEINEVSLRCRRFIHFLRKKYSSHFEAAYRLPHAEDQMLDFESIECSANEDMSANNKEETAAAMTVNQNFFTLFDSDGSNVATLDERAATDNSELVTSDDKELLTDFTYLTMQQVQLQLATLDDIAKGKRKGLRHGFPGLICRHCRNKNVTRSHGAGNTFFSGSVTSLAAVPSVIYSHLERCEFVDEETKVVLQRFKFTHNDDRAKLRHGSQSQFYKRLWTRMFNGARLDPKLPSYLKGASQEEPPIRKRARTNGANKHENGRRAQTQVPLLESFFVEVNTDEIISLRETGRLLDSHQDVLHYLAESDKWKYNTHVKDCVASYYRCVSLEAALWTP